jgi:hypothetical protein
MAMDSIVAEVRQTREAYAKQCNYDVYAMWRDLKERQHKSGRQGVSLSPKRIEPVPLGMSPQRREAPNTCPEGGCQGVFMVFQAPCARLWIREEPRLLSAFR